jgi:hypothetical protein
MLAAVICSTSFKDDIADHQTRLDAVQNALLCIISDHVLEHTSVEDLISSHSLTWNNLASDLFGRSDVESEAATDNLPGSRRCWHLFQGFQELRS